MRTAKIQKFSLSLRARIQSFACISLGVEIATREKSLRKSFFFLGDVSDKGALKALYATHPGALFG